MWVYIRSEPNLYTVGHYAPDGKWHTDSDHPTKKEAADHCAYLNGDNKGVLKLDNGGENTDYTLHEGNSVWIKIGRFSAYLSRSTEGLKCSIYQSNCEMDDSLAECFAESSDLTPNSVEFITED